MKPLENIIILLLVSICYFSCATFRTGPQDSVHEIRKVMKLQEKAWNSGNIDAFMDGYWKSDSLLFIGSSGINRGWTTTINNYKSSYPNKTIMGKLKFDIIKLEEISPTNYYMIGRYTLVRDGDRPSGLFVLLWKYIDGRWLIILDQTC